MPAALRSSARRSSSTISSTVTRVVRAACAISISSRRTPIQTLPAPSAIAAWNRATSGRIAGTRRSGSSCPKGLSITRQSGRWRTRSEPRMPRSGRKGTPFSAACSPAWIAGQVESRSSIAPALTAAVKRGAAPSLAEGHRGRLDAGDAARADQADRPGSRAAARRSGGAPGRRAGSAHGPRPARSRNSPAPAPGSRRSGCAGPDRRR